MTSIFNLILLIKELKGTLNNDRQKSGIKYLNDRIKNLQQDCSQKQLIQELSFIESCGRMADGLSFGDYQIAILERIVIMAHKIKCSLDDK